MRKLRLARERVRRGRFERGFPTDRWEVLGEHSITPLLIPSVTRVYDSMSSCLVSIIFFWVLEKRNSAVELRNDGYGKIHNG